MTSIPASFTNTILLPSTVGEFPRIHTIGNTNEPRKKRAHTKSRRGCIACKLRKVKDQSIMSAILCIAAMHLTTLKPESAKYARYSTQLMSRAINLFRKSLSHPLTEENCEALMGTALLINYISWFDLGFLDTSPNAHPTVKLNISQDQLFFLSPCIVQLWFQAIPIFIDKGSIFTEMIFHHPRLYIEEALRQRGVDPEHFVEPFIEILGDIPDQPSNLGTPVIANNGPTFGAWGFLSGLEKETPSHKECPQPPSASVSEIHDERILMHVKDVVTRICIKYSSEDSRGTTIVPSNSPRSLFTYIIRRLSPLLCCASLTTSTSNAGGYSGVARQSDIEQLLFGFPILCCGPFAKLIFEEDSRALVVILQFYQAVGRLLPSNRCWWAHGRSCLMEELIIKELNCRGVNFCLYI
ncbi:uncharacterized protein KD926_007670 [Aspergillus affinis]|uniref:uncharacterized protein n=1 Tax=Aspergillus affinis TaxID=1070780 RepID=UPI0022FDC627|nr:uncharacterized protein KD926_007670 [Aspergillus affinis]KAI9040862.1 hypothetical protein KD926_007670 [Aspergillus affinis]